VYGPAAACDRGGVVAFNLYDGDRAVAYEEVEAAARRCGIAIRGGCFCNPGAAEHAFGFDASSARTCLDGEFSIPRFRSCMNGPAVGALRASVGIPTTRTDLDRLFELIEAITRQS
jgi:selenocysteine lyase/cysteine desulfurase